MDGILTNICEREQADQALRKVICQLEASQSNLQDKIQDLERFEEVVIGRELKMEELEEEIAQLRGQLTKKDATTH